MELFRQVYVGNGTGCRPSGTDLDPAFVSAQSGPKYKDHPTVTADEDSKAVRQVSGGTDRLDGCSGGKSGVGFWPHV